VYPGSMIVDPLLRSNVKHGTNVVKAAGVVFWREAGKVGPAAGNCP
jgi:hypothetical protein